MHLCMYVISIIRAPCNDGSVLKEQSYCACLLFKRAERDRREEGGSTFFIPYVFRFLITVDVPALRC